MKLRFVPAPVAATIFALLLPAAPAPAESFPENWPQYRGPASDGLAGGATLPSSWSETENVVWRTETPGWGWSSPVVWGDRIFLTSVLSEEEHPDPHVGGYPGGNVHPEDEHRWLVQCIDFESGEILWEREVHRGVPPQERHPRNSYASETPVTDGERLYAYFANIGLFCFSLDGETLHWERRWESYPMRGGWNTGSSPALHGDLLFIQNDNETASFLEAIDTGDGETAWRVERDERSTWSTPYLWETPDRDELVTIGSNRIRSYDPADGTLLWELADTSGLVSLMPVSSGGLLYAGAGYHYGPLYAIRPGASGDISLRSGETENEFIAWSQPRGSSIHPCYLISGHRLFVCYDSGLLACFHAETGETLFPRQRLETEGGRFYASPWAYEGLVFMLNENGVTWVVEDADEYRLVRKNSLGDDVAWATPAIARGSLFIRTYRALYRLQDLGGGEAPPEQARAASGPAR